MNFFHDSFFLTPHDFFRARPLIIMAQKMKHAVHHVKDKLLFKRISVKGCLATRIIRGNDHITQKNLLQSWPLLPFQLAEGENIRSPIFSLIAPVQSFHALAGNKKETHLCTAKTSCMKNHGSHGFEF